MEKYKIEYKGRSVETKHYCEITDEELKEIREEYFKKPSIEQVRKQIATIAKGGVMNDKITRYFFRELMAKVQVSTAKWSIEEVFESKELTGMFKSKTLANKNVFPETKTLAQNIERAIALGGKAYAQTPTNFPIKTMDQLLAKYNINNNFYDYSCGWGARLTSALKNKVNYFGTDPNYELVDRLYNLTEQWRNTITTNTKVDIRAVGSENFQPDWENKIGLAFSSPPYFNLEDYKIGNQSYKEGITYQEWLDNYIIPTLENINKYLVNDGYFIINIKNIKGYNLEKDIVDLSNKYFDYIETLTLKNIQRITPQKELMDNSEKIFVFKKKG